MGACERGLRFPCGCCQPCLEKKRSDWNYRVKQENRHALSSFVLTLTYDEEHLPTRENSEGIHIPTLDKKHVQDFVKRLRRRIQYRVQSGNLPKETRRPEYGLQVRYYAVGEYGSKTDRPHYHIILWNVPRYDIDRIAEVWTEGGVYVDDVDDATIQYVLKYMITAPEMKKRTDRQKPFALMSKRPAIGAVWLETNAKYKKKMIWNNGHLHPTPKYYKEKMGLSTTPEEHLEYSDSAREKRKEAYQTLSKFEEPVQEFVTRKFAESKSKMKQISKHDKF